MTTYANQLRSLAKILCDNEEIPLISVVITLKEAAEKIDMLGELLEKQSKLSEETREALKVAIKATEYKYFGDYEFCESQHDAVDTLVAFAQKALDEENV